MLIRDLIYALRTLRKARVWSDRLQVFVQDGVGRPWRLTGRCTYSGRDLGSPAASIDHFWELYAAEGV